MKTPTENDPKPQREKLGPTGPAKVSGGKEGKESKCAGSEPDERGKPSELETVIDRKRAQTPPD